MKNEQAPRRISATVPFRLPAGSGLHASFATVVEVEVGLMATEPEIGAGGGFPPPVAPAPPGRYPTRAPSGLMVNAARLSFTFSNEATPITFSPRPGAPPEYRPFPPLLPKEATTTMP